jgi:hypothetical protein
MVFLLSGVGGPWKPTCPAGQDFEIALVELSPRMLPKRFTSGYCLVSQIFLEARAKRVGLLSKPEHKAQCFNRHSDVCELADHILLGVEGDFYFFKKIPSLQHSITFKNLSKFSNISLV